ncbi:MAG: thioredoxin family protein [Deltaproteobacteria bacterium]|nr:thioredoxin family protein [Deltaproteobacteria bacterium]
MKRLRILTIAFAITLISALPALAEIYKWTDDKGEVYYSMDKESIPPKYLPKAEVVKGGTVNIIETPKTPASTTTNTTSATTTNNRLDSTWRNGRSGHDDAVDSRPSHKKPVLVYFYTDWCPYCKKLESSVLSSPDVVNALKDVKKVRINPEKGKDEYTLATKYGVTYYPSLFIITPKNPAPRRVNSHWSEDSFIAEINASK